MEVTKGLGKRNRKGATRDFFGSWFASKRSDEAVMDVGYGVIGMIKTNTKVFCKDTVSLQLRTAQNSNII